MIIGNCPASLIFLSLNILSGTALQHLSHKKHHRAHKVEQDQEMKILGHEMTTLASFSAEEKAPADINPEDIEEVVKKYRTCGRFESKDGLQNHFQVKHW